MIKGMIEHSAMYGLERVTGLITDGKKWKPIDYVKATKRPEDKIYELQAQIVKLNNRIARGMEAREHAKTSASRRLFPRERRTGRSSNAGKRGNPD